MGISFVTVLFNTGLFSSLYRIEYFRFVSYEELIRKVVS